MIKRVILHDIASQEDVFDLDNGKTLLPLVVF